MQCLNCRLPLMESDTICPRCRSAAPAVVAKAQERRRKGQLQVGLEGLGSRLARVPALKWAVGLFLFLGAGAVILLALGCYFTYKSDGERGPREVTAAELRNVTSLNSLPDPWVSYTFPRGCETTVRLDKRLLSKTREYSRFILVQVQDHWLAAQVPPDFTGNKLVGKVEELGSWDGTTYEKDLKWKIINDIRASHPDKAKIILPYQVNAVLPYQSRTRGGYVLAGVIALVGLFLGSMGLTVVRAKPRPR